MYITIYKQCNPRPSPSSPSLFAVAAYCQLIECGSDCEFSILSTPGSSARLGWDGSCFAHGWKFLLRQKQAAGWCGRRSGEMVQFCAVLPLYIARWPKMSKKIRRRECDNER